MQTQADKAPGWVDEDGVQADKATKPMLGQTTLPIVWTSFLLNGTRSSTVQSNLLLRQTKSLLR